MKRVRILVDEKVDGAWRQQANLSIRDAYVTIDEHLVIVAAENIKQITPEIHKCLYCNEPDAFETYVVHDELWLSAGYTKGVCHLSCFEKKIGRRVTLGDLKDVPLNRMLKHLLSSV